MKSIKNHKHIHTKYYLGETQAGQMGNRGSSRLPSHLLSSLSHLFPLPEKTQKKNPKKLSNQNDLPASFRKTIATRWHINHKSTE